MAPRRLSCQISANQREVETSANVNKHWKTSAKGNDVITKVISANKHFALTFSMQIPETQAKFISYQVITFGERNNQEQAPVVQTLDNAMYWINLYLADRYWENQLRFPLESDLSRG